MRAGFAGLLIVVMSATLNAQTVSNAPPEGLDLIPETDALIPASLWWQKDLTLRTGIGYKDNALLSPSAPQGTGFFANGLDFSVNRLPLDGLEFVFFVSGDDERYWRQINAATNGTTTTVANGEDIALASVQVKKYIGSLWSVGFEGRESYVDQVEYAFLETGAPGPVKVHGNYLSLTPFVRGDWTSNWWTRLDFTVRRELLSSPLDNSWNFGPVLKMGYTYGSGSEVALSYGSEFSEHNGLAAQAADGSSLSNKLSIWHQEAELRWQQYWDEARHWRSTVRFVFTDLDDNGGGFQNDHIYTAAANLRYRTRSWSFEGAAKYAYHDFPVQTVPITGNPKLHETFVDLSLKADRKLYKSLRVYGELDYDRTFSNESGVESDAKTAVGGVSFEF